MDKTFDLALPLTTLAWSQVFLCSLHLQCCPCPAYECKGVNSTQAMTINDMKDKNPIIETENESVKIF